MVAFYCVALRFNNVTDDEPPPEEIELPIDGTLDLHTFRPNEIGSLIPAYLEECRAKGILDVRIVHGKGTGRLRESVHAILKRNALVANYVLADPFRGGWGATRVKLKPR